MRSLPILTLFSLAGLLSAAPTPQDQQDQSSNSSESSPQNQATEVSGTVLTYGSSQDQFEISTPNDLKGFTPIDPNAPAPDTPKNGYIATGNYTEVKPHMPAGGKGVNASEIPVYNPLSDFDFQSLNLALNQEWIELDLFHHGLAKFSVQDFEDAGLTAEDRHLIEFMANQEVGHAQALTNMLGPRAAKQCKYRYPFKTVHEFVDFCQKLTRFGESGVYGFLPHLDSGPCAQILLQSITTEARQQLIFRQFEGLFPMPVWFEVGVPQSWAWTLLSPYIYECPAENPHIVWANYPDLNIMNNPNATDPRFGPKISTNRTALSYEGREVQFQWDDPGKKTGYNNSYVTSTTAGPPKFAAWVHQLNVTYTPLYNISGNSGWTKQPGAKVFADDTQVNGTVFVALTDADVFLTPANLSLINDHTRAGPALYQAG